MMKIHLEFQDDYEFNIIEDTEVIENSREAKNPIGIGLNLTYEIYKDKSNDEMGKILVDYMNACVEDESLFTVDMVEALLRASKAFSKKHDFAIEIPVLFGIGEKDIPLKEKVEIIKKEKLTYYYECESLIGLALATFDYVFRRGGNGQRGNPRLKRCSHCDRIFISYHRSEQYCQYKSPRYPDMSCRDAESRVRKLKAKNEWGDDQAEMYRQKEIKYNTFSNAISNDTPQGVYWCGRSRFLSEFKKRADLAESGEISYQEVIDWIRSIRPKKYGEEEMYGTENEL